MSSFCSGTLTSENLIGTLAFDLAIFFRTLCSLTALAVYTGIVFERFGFTFVLEDGFRVHFH